MHLNCTLNCGNDIKVALSARPKVSQLLPKLLTVVRGRSRLRDRAGQPQPTAMRAQPCVRAPVLGGHDRTVRQHPYAKTPGGNRHERTRATAPQTQTRPLHDPAEKLLGDRPGRGRRAAAAQRRQRRHRRQLEPDRHQQRLLLLALERWRRLGVDDAGLGRQLRLPVEQRRQLRRRQGVEHRRTQVRELLRQFQPVGQRLPRALRLDHQPAGRVLRRRELRHVPPHRHLQGHGHQRRRHLRHL